MPSLTLPANHGAPLTLRFVPKHAYANATYSMVKGKKLINTKKPKRLSEYNVVAVKTEVGTNNDLFFVRKIQFKKGMTTHDKDAVLEGGLLQNVTLLGSYARRLTEVYGTRRETDERRVFIDSCEISIELTEVLDVAPIVLLHDATYFDDYIRGAFPLCFYSLETVTLTGNYGEQPSSHFFNHIQQQVEKSEAGQMYSKSVVESREPIARNLILGSAQFWKHNKDILLEDLTKKKTLEKHPMVGMDLFAGCGGLTLGLDKEGVATKWAVEYDPEAAESFKRNFPHCNVYNMNVVQFYNILEAVTHVHAFIEDTTPPEEMDDDEHEERKEIKGITKIMATKSGAGAHGLMFTIQAKGSSSSTVVSWETLIKSYGPVEKLRELLRESINKEDIFPTYWNLPAPGDLDVLYAGPPCQGFSRCNRFTEGGTDEIKNLLYFLFIKFARLMQPKYIIAENVEGVLSVQNIGVFGMIIEALKSYNYTIRIALLNSQSFGVPQARRRTILMATLNDVNPVAPLLAPQGHFSCTSRSVFQRDISELIVESFTTALSSGRNWYTNRTTWSSLSDLPPFHDYDMMDPIYNGYPGDRDDDDDSEKDADLPENARASYLATECAFQKEMRNGIPQDNLTMHVSKSFSRRAKMFALAVPFGNKRYWADMPRYLQRALGSNYASYRSSSLNRGHLDLARRTIMTRPCVYSDGLTPDQHRVWSVRENARAQCFPDTFVFVGSRLKRYMQIGNAVPSLLASGLGKSLANAYFIYLSSDSDYDEDIKECQDAAKKESETLITKLVDHQIKYNGPLMKVYYDSGIPPLRSNGDDDIPRSYRENSFQKTELLLRRQKAGRIVEREYTTFPLYLIAQDDSELEYPYLVRNKDKAEVQRIERKRKCMEEQFEQKKKLRQTDNFEVTQYKLNTKRSVSAEELARMRHVQPRFDLNKLPQV